MVTERKTTDHIISCACKQDSYSKIGDIYDIMGLISNWAGTALKDECLKLEHIFRPAKSVA